MVLRFPSRKAFHRYRRRTQRAEPHLSNSMSSAPPSVAWYPPVSANDCKSAYFDFGVDVDRYGSETLEFSDYGTPPTTRYHLRRTPKRYTFRECTIAIALVKSFPRSYLPTPKPFTPEGHWPGNVLGDYQRFSTEFRRVITLCDKAGSPAGWVRAGDGGGLGLFIFGTGSAVDMALRALIPKCCSGQPYAFWWNGY